MLAELSMHIMDIVQNSLSAGASLVRVKIEQNDSLDTLAIEIEDNGRGMTEEEVKRVQDPFFTTKSYKKVGLGIPLFKQIAEHCDGSFEIKSVPGKGTLIRARFRKSHIDLPPIGNLKDTILTLVVGKPDIDFVFEIYKDGESFILDTREIKKELQDVPVNHPEVIRFLEEYIDKNLKAMEVVS
ncbi:MAG: ATP-binding protein [bacterium]|nr:ATP-binding protein [bacterium]